MLTTIEVATSLGRVAVTARGAGPLVVFVPAAKRAAADFDPIVPAFARRFRVATFDWPGTGTSPPADRPRDATASAFASVLRDVVRAPGRAGDRARPLGRWLEQQRPRGRRTRSRARARARRCTRLPPVRSIPARVLCREGHADGDPRCRGLSGSRTDDSSQRALRTCSRVSMPRSRRPRLSRSPQRCGAAFHSRRVICGRPRSRSAARRSCAGARSIQSCPCSVDSPPPARSPVRNCRCSRPGIRRSSRTIPRGSARRRAIPRASQSGNTHFSAKAGGQ